MFESLIETFVYGGAVVLTLTTGYQALKYYTDKTTEERTAQVMERERTKRRIAEIEAKVELSGFQLDNPVNLAESGEVRIDSMDDIIPALLKNPELMKMASSFLGGQKNATSPDSVSSPFAETKVTES